MILSDVCIKRPVFSTVLNIVIILLGLISLERLTVREYPNVTNPLVNIETFFPGASSEIVESQITTPIEDSLSSIEGIDYITSVSRPESSQVTVKFKLNRDPNHALSDVHDRVQRAREKLPEGSREPITSKTEADAQPILWLALTSDKLAPLEVSDIADRFVKDRIQTMNGVADIFIFGQRKFAMRIWINPERLAAYHLTPLDVEEALRKQNVEVPSGRIESDNREFSVLAATDLSTPEQFQEVILKNVNGYLVRIKDIATVKLGPERERDIARYNGKETIALGIMKQATANPLDIAKELNQILPQIRKSLPEGVNLEIAYDTTVFIDYSIQSVFKTIFEAILLVILVIFLFLRSVRATLIPLVTIPVSLIGAFALMHLFGFSINTITLLAMVLAIGLVVDDAIVMLENIYRHIEAGLSPMQAALKGSKEIAFAIIAMTLTLVAVFAPIAFSTGMTGKLFVEFALTLAGAVLVSGFTALTLSPMMCSRLLKKEKQHSHFYTVIEDFLNDINLHYKKFLQKTLTFPKRVVFVTVASFVLTGVLFYTLKSELSPTEDRGAFIAIAMAPEGSTLKYTEKAAKQIEGLLQTVPEVINYFSAVGYPMVTSNFSFVELKAWKDRNISQQEIVQALGPKIFMGIPSVLAFPVNMPSLGQEFSKPLEVVLQTPGSFDELQGIIQKILQEAGQNPGLMNLESNLKLNTPQLKIDVNRNKIAALGTEVENVSRTIESLISGRRVTRFKRLAKQYDVIVQVAEKDRLSPKNLYNIYVRGQNDQMVSLANLASLQETVTAMELNHFNKLRSATISATLAPGYSLGEGVKYLEQSFKKHAPAHFQLEYLNTTREFKESSNTLLFIFVLALCFIYLVLAAQFESFIDPFIILVSVPLALSGALLSLKIFDGTLNIYSQIGLITLVGLITKHGILIVEFANQLLHKGYSRMEAVVEGAVLRLRPIFMTTAAMILGSLPLITASGAGAEPRQQMGYVIVGGLLFGTILTLFVVPTIYCLVPEKRLTT